MTIKLNKYDSAVFLASMEFTNKYGRTPSKLDKYKIKIQNDCPSGFSFKTNPNYNDEETRIIKRINDNLRIKFIINHLKENYPDKDYVDVFQNNNQIKQLNYPIEKSINCIHITEDGRHCELEHNNGCYTCCFVCWNNKCEWTNCIYKDELI